MPEAAPLRLPSQEGWLGREAVLVPVKAFRDAKVRLAPAMSAPERAALAQRMATRVVASAAGLPVAVVCDDAEVAAWARGLGALVIWEPGRGLNGAVHEGVARLATAGAALVVVAAGDLPLATDLRWVTHFPGVTIIPDRRRRRHQCHRRPDDGGFHLFVRTRVIRPSSATRPVASGLPIRIVHSTPLGMGRRRARRPRRSQEMTDPMGRGEFDGPADDRPGDTSGGPGHRRPSGRRRVRVWRHAGQMGGGGMPDPSRRLHRRFEGLLGYRTRPGPARDDPSARTARSLSSPRWHRRSCVSGLARRRTAIRPAAAMGDCLLDPPGSTGRGAGPRPVEALSIAP